MGLQLLEHPECVHCGFCLPACPTYTVLGTEMDNPRGRLFLMDALAAGRIEPTAAVVRHLDLCLGCRACETACPSGVQYGERLEATREQLLHAPGRPLGQRLAQSMILAGVGARPAWQRPMSWLLAAARGSGMLRLIGALAPRGGRLGAGARLLGGPSGRTGAGSSSRLPELTPARGTRRLRVALLTGCIARWMFSGVNAATVRLLAVAGCEVVVPPGQGCCGALHVHSGDMHGARKLVRRNIEAFESAGPLDAVVVNAAGCGAAIKECGRMFADDPAWAERAQALAGKTRDALELLAELDGLSLTVPVRSRVAYHDACHLAHGQGVRNGPRSLLQRIPGLELVPLADADRCCGSAGIYNLLHPDVATAILEPKLAHIEASGADLVAAANPGCLLQIAAGARARGMHIGTVHPIELLDQALDPNRSTT